MLLVFSDDVNVTSNFFAASYIAIYLQLAKRHNLK